MPRHFCQGEDSVKVSRGQLADARTTATKNKRKDEHPFSSRTLHKSLYKGVIRHDLG